MPIVDEKAPRETDFDAMLDCLRGVPADCACVFNCQMGKGRTTTGMIVACLVRDIVHGQDGGKKYGGQVTFIGHLCMHEIIRG